MTDRFEDWIADILAGAGEGTPEPPADPAAERLLASCRELERNLSNLSLALRGHPDRIGPFLLLRPLGLGRSGIVYLGEREADGERAAVRRLAGEGSGPLLATARRAAGFRHEGALAVVGSGEDWIATEASGGVPLSRLVESAAREEPGAAAVPLLRALAPVAAALAAAHGEGLGHGGVSPQKIDLCGDGRLRIRDFGFDPTRRARPPTPERPPLGPAAYLAPEQAGAGGEVGPATDVYSLGATAFAIATGHPPFADRTLTGLLAKVREGRSPPVSAAAPWLPADLAAELDAALAPAAADRPPDPVALAAALASL